MTSIEAIDGEFTGNVLSTPTPADIFLMINVSLTPEPRRAITTP